MKLTVEIYLCPVGVFSWKLLLLRKYVRLFIQCEERVEPLSNHDAVCSLTCFIQSVFFTFLEKPNQMLLMSEKSEVIY